jgi:hypothetical protein
MGGVATLKVRILQAVRRGRLVAWTPDFMGFGNLLSLYLWAAALREAGEQAYVLTKPRFEPWLDCFPSLAPLALRPGEVRFTDQRLMPWSQHARERGDSRSVAPHQQVDLTMVDIFVRRYLLPGSPLVEAAARSAPAELVVNVRRGDYYSVPEIRARYGFDVESYLRIAVSGAVAAGDPSSLVVVSDDPEWCRAHLSWLQDVALVSYVSEGPIEHFTTVASARRIVLTNSTFSYWAAYVSNVLHSDNHAAVWAPAFFDRSQNGGRSVGLDPRWSVVEELPGGWDLPAAASAPDRS